LEEIDELNKRYININDDKEDNKKIIENKIKIDETELELIKLKKYRNIQERNNLILSEEIIDNIKKELEILNLKKKSKYDIKNNNDLNILKNKLKKIDEKEQSYNNIKIKYEEIKEDYIKADEELKRLNKLKKIDLSKLKSKKYYECKEEELKTKLLNIELEYNEINSKLVKLNEFILIDKEDNLC
jgi:hypothetical protein